MNRNIARKALALVCATVLGAAVLAGCGPNASTAATEAQKANRAYMSQVNEAMEELGERLDLFVDAVSRGDIVNMRTQADNAYKALDKLESIEAPDELKDIREDYVNGTAKLRQALDAYIDLYSDTAAKSNSKGNIDEDAFNERVAEIQALYDEGVALLQKGDGTVASDSASSGSASSAASSGAVASSGSAESTSSSDSGNTSESASSADSGSSTGAASSAESTESSSSAGSASTDSGSSAGSSGSAVSAR